MALDNLPWSSLSWFMHRGLKDILLAYGKMVRNGCRKSLVNKLKAEIVLSGQALVKMQWSKEFLYGPMDDMAFGAVMSGGGNSGDVVRIVAAAVEVFLSRNGLNDVDMDKTDFWKEESREHRKF